MSLFMIMFLKNILRKEDFQNKMRRLRKKLKFGMKNFSNLKESKKPHFLNVEWDLFQDSEKLYIYHKEFFAK